MRELDALDRGEAVVGESSLTGNGAATNARPSLKAAVAYLLERFAALPREPCQNCGKPVLPADPASRALSDKTHRKRPLRVLCGHWLHWECANAWMTNPPFAKDCPAEGCGREVYHKDWSESVAVRERSFNRAREEKEGLEAIDDLFG